MIWSSITFTLLIFSFFFENSPSPCPLRKCSLIGKKGKYIRGQSRERGELSEGYIRLSKRKSRKRAPSFDPASQKPKKSSKWNIHPMNIIKYSKISAQPNSSIRVWWPIFQIFLAFFPRWGVHPWQKKSKQLLGATQLKPFETTLVRYSKG